MFSRRIQVEDEPDPDAEACELEQYRHQPSTGCL
jgi:hypothetical protein